MESLIERAFSLAETGKYSVITDLDKVLQAEGFTLADLGELRGFATKKKLQEVMKSAKQAKLVAPGC